MVENELNPGSVVEIGSGMTGVKLATDVNATVLAITLDGKCNFSIYSIFVLVSLTSIGIFSFWV